MVFTKGHTFVTLFEWVTNDVFERVFRNFVYGLDDAKVLGLAEP